MPSTLSDIRAAFEHYIDSYGPILPGEKEEKEVKTVAPIIKAEPTPPVPDRRMSENVYDRISGLIPSELPIANMQTLAELEAYVASATLIDLDTTRINPVFGVGRADADLMVIGEHELTRNVSLWLADSVFTHLQLLDCEHNLCC